MKYLYTDTPLVRFCIDLREQEYFRFSSSISKSELIERCEYLGVILEEIDQEDEKYKSFIPYILLVSEKKKNFSKFQFDENNIVFKNDLKLNH